MSEPPNLRPAEGCHNCEHSRWVWACDNTVTCRLHETDEMDAAQICDNYKHGPCSERQDARGEAGS